MTLDRLDVDLVGDELEQLVVDRRAPRSGQREPGRRERLAGLEAGAAAQRPGQVDGAAGRSPSPPRAPRRGARASSARRPAREVDAVGRVGRRRSRRGSRTSTRRGTAGSARASGPPRRAPRGASRTPRPGRPGRRDRENRRRDRRRYQVDRSSMKRRQRAGRADGVEVAQARLDRRPRSPAARDRIQRSSDAAARRPAAPPSAGRPAGEPGVGHEERVDVPEDQQLAARLVRRVPAEQDVVLGPRLGEHPAHDVDAHPLGRLVELDRVAPALVHRPAVLAEHAVA